MKTPQILSFLIIFFSGLSLNGQNIKTKLLYAVESNSASTQNTRPEYLIPTIENLLLNLKYPNNALRFDTVLNANRLIESFEIDTYLEEIIKLYSDENSLSIEKDSMRVISDSEILNSIRGYDDFLYIKTNSIGSRNLEFQFFRYEIDKIAFASAIPIRNYQGSSSIIINTDSDSSERLALLVKAIKQVFKETNQVPKGRILVNAPLDQDGTYYFAVGDTIKLKGELVDNDSKEEFYQYSWRERISEEEHVQFISFAENSPEQSIVLDTPSCFNIGLLVNDGISDSKEEDSVRVCVKIPPSIRAYEWNVYFNRKLSYTFLTSHSDQYYKEYFQRIPVTILGSDFSELELNINAAPKTSKNEKSGLRILSEKVKQIDLDSFRNENRFKYDVFFFYKIDSFSTIISNSKEQSYYSVRSEIYFSPEFKPIHNNQADHALNLVCTENGVKSEPVNFNLSIKRRFPVMLRTGVEYLTFGKQDSALIASEGFPLTNGWYNPIGLRIVTSPHFNLLLDYKRLQNPDERFDPILSLGIELPLDFKNGRFSLGPYSKIGSALSSSFPDVNIFEGGAVVSVNNIFNSSFSGFIVDLGLNCGYIGQLSPITDNGAGGFSCGLNFHVAFAN